jgi:hypothetical protein
VMGPAAFRAANRVKTPVRSSGTLEGRFPTLPHPPPTEEPGPGADQEERTRAGGGER